MIRFLQTKGRVQQALLIGFLTIICVMMVVTLVPGGVFNTGVSSDPNTVAKVGSEEISIREVNRTAQNMMRQQFPRGNAPEAFMGFFRQQALQQLIVQNLALSEAKRMGLEATESELKYELEHGPMSRALFPDGKFIGTDAYRNLIQDNFQMTIPQFEDLVKKQLTLRKLRAVITSGVTVTNAEVHDEYMKSREKVKFDYAVLNAADLEKQVQVSESELRAYYEKNQAQFANSIPEQRKVKYVLIDATNLPEKPKVSDADLQAYYNAHQDQFKVPESATVRHILIKTPLPGPDGKVDQKAADAAKAKAQDVLKQVKAGGDFAALAKKYSEDAPTAKNGGLVGQLVQGSGAAPEIEKVAFTLQKGQTSDLIPTSYGFEIIKVDERTAAHQKTLAEVKSQIEPIVMRDAAQKAAQQLAQKVETDAKTQGLEKAAAANHLTVTTTDFFPRTASLPGLGSAPQFMDAVFAQADKSAPQAVVVPQGYAVVQTAEIKPPSTPSFEQVKGQIEQQFRREKAQALLAQKAKELEDKAKSMHDLKAAAKAVGATVKTSELVSAGQQVPELGQLRPDSEVFTLKQGEISSAIQTPTGAAVLMVTERQAPTDAEFQGAKDDFREAMLDRKRQMAEELYLGTLRANMEKSGKLKIDAKRMAALTGGAGTE
ncbi:MAG TPA: peptidyl-prolyl cis-trans isomerase [Candidatus Acidoferrales bacterium]|nr:peptidyl-prolyl cis-trans isomerase [Candidatus Acidoferrales bacterium]